uniref:Uncharacterized protein n=1 Tax=viral metagenome TaxID=1070528 RepID=A0A6C0E602_9ZZZZ
MGEEEEEEACFLRRLFVAGAEDADEDEATDEDADEDDARLELEERDLCFFLVTPSYNK